MYLKKQKQNEVTGKITRKSVKKGDVKKKATREQIIQKTEHKIRELSKLTSVTNGKCYNQDFLLTWNKTQEEIKAHLIVADILKLMRTINISPKIVSSGLGISLFRDNSTRTRFSYSSACNFLGYEIQDFDEGSSQISHGETLRETVNMISFMTDVIGIRDDKFIGQGHEYMANVSKYVRKGHDEGVLEQIPTIVNLQCDRDHPTQSMSDLNHLVQEYRGLENLKGKKFVMSWAYSPSYGKPLSVPQGAIALMTRFGMDVVLAYPEGYELMGDQEDSPQNIIKIAEDYSKKYSGGKFRVTHNMKDAIKDADIVYAKSWAPFKAMKKRTEVMDDYKEGKYEEEEFELKIEEIKKELLDENAKHKEWETTKDMMKLAKEDAIYLHCLPADITKRDEDGKVIKAGEVQEEVFDDFRVKMYNEAGNKPYIISSMIFLSKMKNPVGTLSQILKEQKKRILY